MKKRSNPFGLVICTVCSLLVPMSRAAEEETTVYGWRVSAGANFGFGLKTNLKLSPTEALRRVPAIPYSPRSSEQSAAGTAILPVPGGSRVDLGDGAFVDPSCEGNDPDLTWNWRLPDSAHRVVGGDDCFELSREWGGYENLSESSRTLGSKNDDETYGASVDFSRVIWAGEDRSWGVDFVLGLQYLRADNCYRASGRVFSRDYDVVAGSEIVRIFTDTPMRGWSADPEGFWGAGTAALPVGGAPSLDLADIETDSSSVSRHVSQSMRFSARGDYEELEIALMLRPWYNIFDWWSVHGNLGVGISRSEFEYSMCAALNGSTIYSSRNTFDEWACYGLAGLGTSFSWRRFDLGCDFFCRFCQDEMEIRDQNISGSIDKPNLHVRVYLGCSF